ncbi:MAG: class I SAM-dependent RNA methyltransferase [Deltaproteobacteria bacterium]|nr:class I SAM-dependent RNA methyltransferase [Deltaproteobacteria bacterium]
MVIRKAMELNEIIAMKIDSVAFGGKGVGRVEGAVVFVPYAAPGDELSVRITKVRKNYCEGSIEKILSPSPHRVPPKCRYYGQCGGCHYQHLDYRTQLSLKERQVVESFERIGRIPSPPVRPIIPSEKIYHYRGKAEYHLRRGDGGSWRLGFVDDGGRVLVDIGRCEIVDESINDEYGKFRAAMKATPPRAPARLAFWSGTGYRSASRIVREVKGKSLLVPYGGFFQANLSCAGTLVDTVRSLAGPRPSDTFLDCYCGSGLFSIFIAPDVHRSIGLDSDTKAVECARENASRQGVKNVQFFDHPVEEMGRVSGGRGERPFDCLILDPPRTGCSNAVLEGIAALMPQRIVYVSCNPATQARDVRFLIDRGFTLAALQPVDMFPQTKHIEAAALLERSI